MNPPGLVVVSALRGERAAAQVQLLNSSSCIMKLLTWFFPRLYVTLLLCKVVVSVGESVTCVAVGNVLESFVWDGGGVELGLWGSSSSQEDTTDIGLFLAGHASYLYRQQTTLICRLSRRGAVCHYHVLLASGILSELHNRNFCFLKHFLLSLIMLRFPVNTVSCNYHL